MNAADRVRLYLDVRAETKDDDTIDSYGDAHDDVAELLASDLLLLLSMAESRCEYLSVQDVAARLNVQPETVHTNRHRGIMPQPDIMLGAVPGWLPATIDQWQASRPGKGWGAGRKRNATPDGHTAV